MVYNKKEYKKRIIELRSVAEEIIMKKKPEDARKYSETLKGEDAYIFGRIVEALIECDFHHTGITPY